MGEKFHVLVVDLAQFGCECNGNCSDRTLSMLDGLQKESSLEVDAGKIPGCYTLLKVAGDYDAIIMWDDEGWQADTQFIREKYPEIKIVIISNDLTDMKKATSLDALMVSQRRRPQFDEIIFFVIGKMNGGVIIF